MKQTKYTRSKSQRHSKQNSNFSFAIQMIALALVLYFFVFGTNISIPTSQEKNVLFSPKVTETEVSTEENNVSEEPTVDENALPLEIHQIDVSCANAYLIRYDGFTIFVDGGQPFAYDNVVEYLENFGVETIDCYIATHWHNDHASNMPSILKAYGTDRTLVYGTTEEPYERYEVSNGAYMRLVQGAAFEIGDVKFVCVGPDEVIQDGHTNYDSLNILIQYNDFKFLMTGDYMKNNVVEMYGDLVKDLDVLQMPHHGLTPLSISEKALRHCNPSTILVPANSSEPTYYIVQKLELDADILDNTDGCIAVISYGNGYEVYTNVVTPNDYLPRIS